jgi:hypothetical protein
MPSATPVSLRPGALLLFGPFNSHFVFIFGNFVSIYPAPEFTPVEVLPLAAKGASCLKVNFPAIFSECGGIDKAGLSESILAALATAQCHCSESPRIGIIEETRNLFCHAGFSTRSDQRQQVPLFAFQLRPEDRLNA